MHTAIGVLIFAASLWCAIAAPLVSVFVGRTAAIREDMGK